jgi:DNA-binding PadR family transcriptional regulator
MSNIEDTDDRAKKERSPSYPFISLPRAIERAQSFNEAHRRSPARVAAIADTWKYAPSSSGLLQTLSALKAYGLLEDTGKGQDRKVQLTDLGQKILHDTRPGAKETAIREAALGPRLFREYAEKWLPVRPSDSHCLSELRIDRGFTDVASKMFLRSFDETFAFANLSGEDKLSQSAGAVTSLEEGNELSEGDALLETAVTASASDVAEWPWLSSPPARFYGGRPVQELVQAAPGAGRFGPNTATGVRSGLVAPRQPQSPRATLPLPEGPAALEIPQRLSRKSFEALKSWTEMMISLAERSVSSKWYVEWYTPTSTKAEEHYLLSDWTEVKDFMAEFRKSIPGVIFRVIAPDDAPASDLAELRSAGVRTF